MTSARRWQSYKLSGLLAVGVCIAVAALAFLGLRASQQFKRSSFQLAQRHADEGARLLAVALMRDMRAVQSSVLSSPAWDEPDFDTHEAMTLVASAFARYPYPEAFFAWRTERLPEHMTFFTRSDRQRPGIHQLEAEQYWYPVRLAEDPALATLIMGRLTSRTSTDLSLVSGIAVNGVPYQVVARLKYRDDLRQEVDAVYGFLVNLEWARDYYFSELTGQVLKIAQDESGVVFSILDEQGAPVVGAPAAPDLVVSRRVFPVAFFDPLQGRPSNLAVRNWTILAGAAPNPVPPFSAPGLDFALGIAALAAVALAASLVVTAGAMRASARLAEMRADFMSSVTHELKTPIASIRAMADTLTRGRLRDPLAQQEYASVVMQEAVRLSRLVDNVLAYARITDVADVYSFERIDVDELVNTVLRRFRHQLQNFAVTEDVAPDVPTLWADRLAMELLLDNLIDNAIRYSSGVKELHVGVIFHHGLVKISVSDRGIGIPPNELSRVTRKFVRGRNTKTQGSGLGLAIVERITKDHGGSLSISSRPDGGTSVEVALRPALDEGAREQASSNQWRWPWRHV